MSEESSNDLFDEIIKMEGKIAFAESKCIKMKNDWLESKGWTVTEKCRRVDVCYLYRKGNLVGVDADAVMDKEMIG